MTRAAALLLFALAVLTVRAGVDPAWLAVFTVAVGVGTALYLRDCLGWPAVWNPPPGWTGAPIR